MPSMYEIYNQYSVQYDELVNHEDYQGNLRKYLDPKLKNSFSVLELGVGTGRLTKLYINKAKAAVLCDRSVHMIEQAKKNLIQYLPKIDFQVIDTRSIQTVKGKYDLIIEGWSLGHVALEEYDSLKRFIDKLIKDLTSKLNTNGNMIFIETYGSNVEEPTIPGKKLREFYEILEKEHGFKREIISTDYMFDSAEESKRIMTFFFGEEVGKEVKEKRIKEYTGIWERVRNNIA